MKAEVLARAGIPAYVLLLFFSQGCQRQTFLLFSFYFSTNPVSPLIGDWICKLSWRRFTLKILIWVKESFRLMTNSVHLSYQRGAILSSNSRYFNQLGPPFGIIETHNINVAAGFFSSFPPPPHPTKYQFIIRPNTFITKKLNHFIISPLIVCSILCLAFLIRCLLISYWWQSKSQQWKLNETIPVVAAVLY